MLSLDQERAHLAKADQDIAECQRRITAQGLRIQEMRLEGRDTLHAAELLVTLQATLTQWQAHREEILQTIYQVTACS